MAPEERRTFYLYSIGHPPEQLALGHVVMGDYANPTQGLYIPQTRLRFAFHITPRRQYGSAERLSELQNWNSMFIRHNSPVRSTDLETLIWFSVFKYLQSQKQR